nr:DUF1285 domain-containing protein [Motiliproteus sediminis]
MPAQKSHPVARWQPSRSGVIDIRIAANGDWFHEGELIRREALVTLFASILRRDPDGYYLVTPAEKQRITVEDAPLLVSQLQHEGEGRTQRLLFLTRTGDAVEAGPAHRLWVEDSDGEPRPYLMIRDGLHARIGRNVFYQLVELAQPATVAGVERLGVWSNGLFLPLDGEDVNGR